MPQGFGRTLLREQFCTDALILGFIIKQLVRCDGRLLGIVAEYFDKF